MGACSVFREGSIDARTVVLGPETVWKYLFRARNQGATAMGLVPCSKPLGLCGTVNYGYLVNKRPFQFTKHSWRRSLLGPEHD